MSVDLSHLAQNIQNIYHNDDPKNPKHTLSYEFNLNKVEIVLERISKKRSGYEQVTFHAKIFMQKKDSELRIRIKNVINCPENYIH